ncbi:TPA: hypothetical protein BOS_23094 [Bos taurus]|nr:TPA: hypothetical protein BOS_23094 [Bos taurus]
MMMMAQAAPHGKDADDHHKTMRNMIWVISSLKQRLALLLLHLYSYCRATRQGDGGERNKLGPALGARPAGKTDGRYLSHSRGGVVLPICSSKLGLGNGCGSRDLQRTQNDAVAGDSGSECLDPGEPLVQLEKDLQGPPATLDRRRDQLSANPGETLAGPLLTAQGDAYKTWAGNLSKPAVYIGPEQSGGGDAGNGARGRAFSLSPRAIGGHLLATRGVTTTPLVPPSASPAGPLTGLQRQALRPQGHGGQSGGPCGPSLGSGASGRPGPGFLLGRQAGGRLRKGGTPGLAGRWGPDATNGSRLPQGSTASRTASLGAPGPDTQAGCVPHSPRAACKSGYSHSLLGSPKRVGAPPGLRREGFSLWAEVIRIEEDGCRRNPGLCKARFNGPPVSFLLAGGGDKPSEPARAGGPAGCAPRPGPPGSPPPPRRAF